MRVTTKTDLETETETGCLGCGNIVDDRVEMARIWFSSFNRNCF